MPWSDVSNPSTTWGVVSSPSTIYSDVAYFLNGRPIGLLLVLTYFFASAPAVTSIAITPGSGANVSIDRISGVDYQRIKLIDPTVDSTTPLGVSTISGDKVLKVDVVQSVSTTTLGNVGILAGDNNIGNVDIVTMPNVTIGSALPAGTNLIGDVGIQGRTTGGLTIFRSIDLDETEEEVKATAGTVYGIYAINTTAAPLYLKIYNATAANVTVGTTTPVLTLPIVANADSDGAGMVISIVQGIAFGTAITAAVTTGVADADVGAPSANAAIVQIFYA